MKLKFKQNDAQAGDVVKMRIHIPPGSDISRAQARKAAQEWAEKAGVQLYGIEVIATKPRAEKTVEARAQHSDEELVRAYVKKTGKGKGTLAVGLKIAEEVT